jgi:hypothetical protein
LKQTAKNRHEKHPNSTGFVLPGGAEMVKYIDT